MTDFHNLLYEPSDDGFSGKPRHLAALLLINILVTEIPLY
jgi:hypothetical protein